jgi:hypothetical protein
MGRCQRPLSCAIYILIEIVGCGAAAALTKPTRRAASWCSNHMCTSTTRHFNHRERNWHQDSDPGITQAVVSGLQQWTLPPSRHRALSDRPLAKGCAIGERFRKTLFLGGSSWSCVSRRDCS